MTTSTLVTASLEAGNSSGNGISIEDIKILEQILYIHYLIYFQESQTKAKALIHFGNKVNGITPTYI